MLPAQTTLRQLGAGLWPGGRYGLRTDLDGCLARSVARGELRHREEEYRQDAADEKQRPADANAYGAHSMAPSPRSTRRQPGLFRRAPEDARARQHLSEGRVHAKVAAMENEAKGEADDDPCERPHPYKTH